MKFSPAAFIVATNKGNGPAVDDKKGHKKRSENKASTNGTKPGVIERAGIKERVKNNNKDEEDRKGLNKSV